MVISSNGQQKLLGYNAKTHVGIISGRINGKS
jgi:hypothetical protein